MVAASVVPAVAHRRELPRNAALDFTKGTLVLLMVLYHWINYFIGPQWGYYNYFRFLTPSFIFISGFIISNIYLSKYQVSDPRLPMRLLSRGLKLLTIFVFLNASRLIAVQILGTGTSGRTQFAPWSLFAIFISGNLPDSGSKIVSFPILVPISYLLAVSGVLMNPTRLFKYAFHVMCSLMLLVICGLDLLGRRSFNLEYIAIGIMGVLVGFVSMEKVKKVVKHPLAVTLFYVTYLIAITRWGVPFPLLVIGVVLTLMIIYSVGERDVKVSSVRGAVDLLGKYSLLGYIGQIVILQVLSASFHRLHLGRASFAISFVAAFALTIASVELTDYGRARVPGLDRLYKAVFA